MNREQETLNLVEIDQPEEQSKNNLKIKVEQIQENAAEKFDDFNQAINYQMRNVQDHLGFKGDKTQIFQQTALLVSILELIIATQLSMLISQITFLGKAWTFLPGFQYIFLILYLITIISIQYFNSFVQKQNWNFLFGFIHTLSKIILIIYLNIYLFDIRIEVFLAALISIKSYLAFKIYVKTQKQEECKLKVKYMWKKLIVFQLCVTIFLIFFTRSSYTVGLMVFSITILIGIYTILCLQKIKESTYFNYNSNDLYLSSLQLDADMLLPCQLIQFLNSNKTSLEQSFENNNNEQVNEVEQKPTSGVLVQSENSIAENK